MNKHEFIDVTTLMRSVYTVLTSLFLFSATAITQLTARSGELQLTHIPGRKHELKSLANFFLASMSVSYTSKLVGKYTMLFVSHFTFV